MIGKAIDHVTRIITYISAITFLIIVIIVLANIVGRAAFNAPIRGAVEIVQYGMVFCVGIVMSRSGLLERHICVSLVIEKFSKRVTRIFMAFGKLLGAGTFGLLTYLYIANVMAAIHSNRVTDTFRIPFQVVFFAMAICFLLAALVFVYQMISFLISAFRDDDAIVADAESKIQEGGSMI
jgi:TRAP-type C4-dicarboxylate transport system permease small subunit